MRTQNEKMQKIGGFALLMAAVISMLVITIQTSISGDILESLALTQCSGNAGDDNCDMAKVGHTAGENSTYTYSFNLTRQGIIAFDDLSDWFPTIIAVVAAVVILTFIMLLSKPQEA